jgi:hypothetical protein
MGTPDATLDLIYQEASQQLDTSRISDERIRADIEYICRTIQNRAGARLLLACALAKVDQPTVDIRKPYTEIGGADSYSGRTYDERYITDFINRYSLPCNSTTAFLTPALRNHSSTLTIGLNLVGRPPRLYETVLSLLDAVHQNQVSAEQLLYETVRWLIIVRDENQQRRSTLLAALQSSHGEFSLSAEAIVRLVQQHLDQPRSSRLPVLVVAAAYQAASGLLGETVGPLSAHNAADEQTQSLGDLEIEIVNDRQIVASYEMKARLVTRADIERAIQKITTSTYRVHHYVFITTDTIDPDVAEYARNLYDDLGGTEIVILDCIQFLRHYLHLFHRLRMAFLEAYQALVLNEPDSAVNQPLKEVFLSLRQSAESRD